MAKKKKKKNKEKNKNRNKNNNDVDDDVEEEEEEEEEDQKKKKKKNKKNKNKQNKKKKSEGGWGDDEEKKFQEQLNGKNLQVVEVAFDGNCLFRAVSFQMTGSQDEHGQVRQQVAKVLAENEETFGPFVSDETTFEEYCGTISEDGEWGGQIELMALSKLFQCAIVVHQLNMPAYSLVDFSLQEMFEAGELNVAIHLSYHDGMHYNAVRLIDGDDCQNAQVPIRFDEGRNEFVFDANIEKTRKLCSILEGKTKDEDSKSRKSNKNKSKNKNKNKKKKLKPRELSQVKQIMSETGIENQETVVATLREMEGDVESTIEFLHEMFPEKKRELDDANDDSAGVVSCDQDDEKKKPAIVHL